MSGGLTELRGVYVRIITKGVHAMLLALLSAAGITALLFVGLFRFCHMVIGWLMSEAP